MKIIAYIVSALLLFSQTSSAQVEEDTTKTVAPQKIDTLRLDLPSPSPFVCQVLWADTSILAGSKYTTFADIMDLFPGVYHHNRGSVGQKAFTSFFAGSPGDIILEYDGLILNDPLTGKADLNIIPTESIGRIRVEHGPNHQYGYMPSGQSLHLSSHNMASLPIRSQVAYRTGGHSYNDVDVRLGILVNKSLAINAGGLSKLYFGTMPNTKYKAERWNLKIDKQMTPSWSLHYVFLNNKSHVRFPLADTPPEFDFLQTPHQQDNRADHGLFLRHSEKLELSFQHTRLNRKVWTEGYVFDETHSIDQFRMTGSYTTSLDFFKLNAGIYGQGFDFDSKVWGNHRDWQAAAWLSFSGNAENKLDWRLTMRGTAHQEYEMYPLPEISIFYNLSDSSRIFAFANRIVTFPSLEARYTQGPFGTSVYKNPQQNQLYTGETYQVVAGMEKQTNLYQLFASLSLQNRLQHIQKHFIDESVYFTNRTDYTCLQADAHFNMSPFKNLSFWAQGAYFSSFDTKVINRPNWFSQVYAEYKNTFFKGDIDLKIRLGATILGARYGAYPFYADWSSQTVSLSPQLDPYVHVNVVFGNARLFFAFDNFINQEYQQVYGYTMPKTWMRYGFVWSFWD